MYTKDSSTTLGYSFTQLFISSFLYLMSWSLNSLTTIPQSIALTITPRGHLLICYELFSHSEILNHTTFCACNLQKLNEL